MSLKLAFVVLFTICTLLGCSDNAQYAAGGSPASLTQASILQAAAAGSNWYVRKGATGTNNGSNWTNAFNEMNQINWGSIACGDTVWIAGGKYSGSLTVSKNCTAATPLTINRVLSSDTVATAAAGWASSYDSQIILPNISVPGPAAYIVFNGREWQGQVLGSGGIQVLIPGTSGDGIDASNNGNGGPAIDHITWSYIEVYGPACVENGTCSDQGVIGVNVMPYCTTANRTNMLFDHLNIHRTGEAFRGCGWDSSTIQYSLISDTHNDGQQHEDIIYSNPPYQNVTWRYNKIFMSPNDGIFFESCTGAKNFSFYGNVVYHSGGSLMTFKPESGSCYGPVYIYNNVFENDTTFGDYQPGWLSFNNMVAGSSVKNNVFENVSTTAGENPPSADYNAYSTSIGLGDSGTHSFVYNPGTLGSSIMFVSESPSNPIAANFHLTSAGVSAFSGKGVALPAPYNIDADGTFQGKSGTGSGWSIGAYAVGGTTTNPTPTPTPNPTPKPTPTPTPPPTPTPTPTPVNTVEANFNSLAVNSSPASGYPAAGFVWSGFWVTPAYDVPQFSTQSISTTSASSTSGSITLPAGYTLKSFQAGNGDSVSHTVSVSCAGNSTVTINIPANAAQATNVTTGWTAACAKATFSISGGWSTDLDNFVFSTVTGSASVTK